MDRRGVARGEVVSLSRLWELSIAWYHNRLDPDYRGRSVQEAEAIFHAAGLVSPFWSGKKD